jgi:hypothetical protein
MTGMHSCSLPIQQGLNAPPPVVELDDDDDDEKKEKEMHINFDILSDDWMELVTINELVERYTDFPVIGSNAEVSYVSHQECSNEFLFDVHFSISMIPSLSMLEEGLRILNYHTQQSESDDDGLGMIKFEGYSGVWDRETIVKGLNLFKAKEYIDKFTKSKEWLDTLDISNLSPIFAEKKHSSK